VSAFAFSAANTNIQRDMSQNFAQSGPPGSNQAKHTPFPFVNLRASFVSDC